MDPNKVSSEYIENKVLTIVSENSSSEDNFDTKLQANFDKFDLMFWTTRLKINGFHETIISIMETDWRIAGSFQLINNVPLICFWSDQWNINQASIKFSCAGEEYF